ncbi:MAG: PEGA domain-containing protein [Spirochaetales bacterium]|nr:PEGA domain-containing protein [Spirochaetales bacterium]
MKIKLFIYVQLIVFSFPLVHAQTPTPLVIKVPEDRRYVVAITEFKDINLETENKYLVYSLPLQIKESIESIKSHSIKPEYLRDYRRQVLEQELEKYKTQLEQLQKQRDELLFNMKNSENLEKLVEDFDKKSKYTELMETIDEIRKYDKDKIEFPENLDIIYKIPEKGGALIKPPQFSAFQFCRREKIDLLIYGSLEEVQGFIFIQIFAYEAALEKEIFKYTNTVTPDEMYSFIDEIADKLAPAILGQDWSRLVVAPDPEDCRIYLDEEFISIGRIELKYVVPGKHEIAVVHPDCKNEIQDIELAPFETRELQIALIKSEIVKIKINSDPEGADLYINSVWSGKTPLEIDSSEERRRAYLKLEGYDDYIFSLDATTPAVLNFTLNQKIGDQKEKQTKARDDFYLAFGFFLVSLPLPILCSRLSQDYLKVAELAEGKGYSAQAADMRLRAQILDYAFYGTLALTSGLFVFTAITIINYIIAADRPLG